MNGMETLELDEKALENDKEFDDLFDASFNNMTEIDNDVEHPAHYQSSTGLEVYQVLKSFFNIDEYRGFLKGNIIKYVLRCDKKENAIKDLKKSKWYLDKLVFDYINS